MSSMNQVSAKWLAESFIGKRGDEVMGRIFDIGWESKRGDFLVEEKKLSC